jgi:hypothetical protein
VTILFIFPRKLFDRMLLQSRQLSYSNVITCDEPTTRGPLLKHVLYLPQTSHLVVLHHDTLVISAKLLRLRLERLLQHLEQVASVTHPTRAPQSELDTHLVDRQKRAGGLPAQHLAHDRVRAERRPRLAHAPRHPLPHAERLPFRRAHLARRPSAVARLQHRALAHAARADADDARQHRVWARGPVDELELEVVRAGRAAQPDGRLAVVRPPRDVRAARPEAVLHARVGRGRGEQQRGERGEVREDGREERALGRGERRRGRRAGRRGARGRVQRDVHVRGGAA